MRYKTFLSKEREFLMRATTPTRLESSGKTSHIPSSNAHQNIKNQFPFRPPPRPPSPPRRPPPPPWPSRRRPSPVSRVWREREGRGGARRRNGWRDLEKKRAREVEEETRGDTESLRLLSRRSHSPTKTS